MQLRLPLYTDAPPALPVDPATLFGPLPSAETEVTRLQAELAAIAQRQAKQEKKRDNASRAIRKLRDRQRSLALQIESLQSNPYAIGRYRSSLPSGIVSTLWWDRPTSELRLEGINGIGSRRLRIIYDRCPTIGDMEVFRVYEGLTSVPGIRMITAKRIEKRLFDWLDRHAHDYAPMPCAEFRTGMQVEKGMPSVI